MIRDEPRLFETALPLLTGPFGRCNHGLPFDQPEGRARRLLRLRPMVQRA
ncbi:MAG: hypothetical protein AVDCRST_MAG49-835 [uncultured Thermomicrobiales bacterium]|uniref:Uncharacterized protein n=1 Tax=uncultured Thermomicrobiales bacterium TaxID=1645740 RepID=A0A6J4U7R1_9BACT|nr:MAG: hypothetical protein AVDCRST_MAG49-835 [uncultured Thermomicrobiales bacterium]